MSSLFPKEDDSLNEKPTPTEMPGWQGEDVDTPPPPLPSEFESRSSSSFPLQGTATNEVISQCPKCSGTGKESTGICGGYLVTTEESSRQCVRCSEIYTSLSRDYTVLVGNISVCTVATGQQCSICRGSGKVKPA